MTELTEILVVDDEELIANGLKFNLENEKFVVDVAYDGITGLEKTLKNKPHIVILDVMLPGLSGLEVCKAIRKKLQTIIIMLSAKGSEEDKVLSLNLGADDYITKPFGIKELIARINAIMNRSFKTVNKILKIHDLQIDLEKYEIKRNKRHIETTLKEFELLKFFAENLNKVCTRETLLREIWGYKLLGDIRIVDVTIRRLREKIEIDSKRPKYILTKHGVGYYASAD